MIIVYLIGEESNKVKNTGVFIKDKGAIRELEEEEVKKMLDEKIDPITNETRILYQDNLFQESLHLIDAVGGEKLITNPSRVLDIKDPVASDIILKLSGMLDLINKYKKELKSKDQGEEGYDKYERVKKFTEDYIAACKEHPYARIKVEDLRNQNRNRARRGFAPG